MTEEPPMKQAKRPRLDSPTEGYISRIVDEVISRKMTAIVEAINRRQFELCRETNEITTSGFQTVIAMLENIDKTTTSGNEVMKLILKATGDTQRPLQPPEQVIAHDQVTRAAVQKPQQKERSQRVCTYCTSSEHIGANCPKYPDGFSRQTMLYNNNRCLSCGRLNDFLKRKCLYSKVRCASCPPQEPNAFHMPSACQYKHPQKATEPKEQVPPPPPRPQLVQPLPPMAPSNPSTNLLSEYGYTEPSRVPVPPFRPRY